MKHVAKDKQTVQRRLNTIARLEAQLKLGLKQPKGTFMALDKTQLSVEDRNRINNELTTLKNRV